MHFYCCIIIYIIRLIKCIKCIIKLNAKILHSLIQSSNIVFVYYLIYLHFQDFGVFAVLKLIGFRSTEN